MRRINTAQARIVAAAGGRYGTLVIVLQQQPTLQPDATGATETTASLAGYTLVTTDDGRRRQAAVTPERTCGLALFTNQRGLIYRGWVLDCPTP